MLKVKNGNILPLEPIDETHEGQNVITTFVEENEDWNKLFVAIEENQIESETNDLAHEHDHHLYGTDKRN